MDLETSSGWHVSCRTCFGIYIPFHAEWVRCICHAKAGHLNLSMNTYVIFIEMMRVNVNFFLWKIRMIVSIFSNWDILAHNNRKIFPSVKLYSMFHYRIPNFTYCQPINTFHNVLCWLYIWIYCIFLINYAIMANNLH